MTTFARRTLRGLAAAALLLAAPGPAGAAILYDQPADYPPNNFGFYTSATGAGSAGFRVYDSFTLSTAATVTGFNWQGIYYDFLNLFNNPVNPSTTTWQIGVFASDPVTGLPGAALRSQSQPAATVEVTFVADALIFDGRPSPVRVLSFHADLLTPFEAEAGVTYWFSPFSLQPNFNPIFAWTSGTGGDGRFVQDNLSTGNRNFSTDRDRAFSVEGNAVPAPPGFALLGLGAALACRFRTRRPAACPAAD